ncbi:MAG: AAA family ATPase [Deltaproteobacteria bacterium]|uniref:AAA family ATPase n=1 Tax=Candidatus Desulfacyla euxinica TaxID=2841693 RepID=A0A8J6N239_9DELT|nr:AAA family ATPase [Candidatus Desulfacyla euxinica]MBL7216092.1 AAA family ATPase [Desulfobacteraceae bacterium]
MKCPKCQFNNRVGAKFCKECGNKFELTCPQCENAYTPGAKFCDECGHAVQTPKKEAPPIVYDEPRSYTPKHLADKILTIRASIEGERKVVTVLFADVADSTAIFEKLDPEKVHQVMDGCFRILMDEIHRYEGTVNQFRGDCVMALFGAPLAHEDHARRACFASLSIQRAMKGYSEDIMARFGMEFKMRIGLDSGLVVVGSIGNNLRMDYTADGDTANLAARMESLAKPGTVLVSGNTYKLAENYFEFEPLGKVQVKGKEAPQEAYVLLRPSHIGTRIAASAARGLTRFVGRKNSMAAIERAYDRAQSGSGQIVGVVSGAGVGKSRLLLEFRNRLPQDEFVYLEGRCLYFGESTAYSPIVDILKSYFEIKDDDEEDLVKKKLEQGILQRNDNLENILTPLYDLLSLEVNDEAYLRLKPVNRRGRIFEALRDLFINISPNKPLILAVEDLHWIDKTSEEFLGYLIGRLANTRILLILLYRPEFTHPWGSSSNYNRIGLNQLTTNSSIELIQAILERGEVIPELRKLILGKAGGNPLFLEELTHSLLENDSLKLKDKKYVLSQEVADIEVPDTIQGIIASRIDRLEDNLKLTIQIASVIGRDFTFRILKEITGMKDGLKTHLLELQEMEFIYEKAFFPELEFIFKHALIQEVAYSSLLLNKRKEIHKKIGRAIEGIYTEKLDEFYEMLAYHYSKSEDRGKAYQYLKLSGEKAIKSHAMLEAFHFFNSAYQVLKGQPETEENQEKQLEILHLILFPILAAGYPGNSLQLLMEGQEISKRTGDDRSLAIFYSRIGRYYGTKEGKLSQGIKYSEKSFQEAEKLQDVQLIIRTGFDLFPSYFLSGQLSRLIELSPKIISLLEETGKVHESFGSGWNVYSGVHGYYGLSMGWVGNFGEGKEILEKGLCFTTGEVDDKFSLAWVEMAYGMLLNIKGEGQNAIEHARRAIDLLTEIKGYAILGVAWNYSAWAHYLMGEFEIARKHIEKALKTLRETGMSFWVSFGFLLSSMVHYDSGDFENAQEFLREAIKLSEQNDEYSVLGYSRIWKGRILGRVDSAKRDEANQLIMRGIKLLDELKIKPWSSQGYLFLGELYLNTGKTEKALENLKRAEGMFLEMGMDYWLDKMQEVLRSV